MLSETKSRLPACPVGRSAAKAGFAGKLYSVLLIIIFSLTTNIFPQVQFIPHTISTGLYLPYSVYAIDLDSDGDVDVLSGSYGHKIRWHENDGNENFTPHIITTNVVAWSVYALDVDGDGDVDVLSGSESGIAWYENDGNENFTSHTIATGFSLSVYAVDVDGDGDIDVLSSLYGNHKIAWYENDGNENFTSHTISTIEQWAGSVFAVDVDGDGDIDVLSTSGDGDVGRVSWFENDGNENFTIHLITTNATADISVYAADVDGDGDIDILSGRVIWYENDGNENFTIHMIAPDYETMSVYALDVDGDGDIDVLSSGLIGGESGRVSWYENDGNENFTSHIISNTAGASYSVYALDIDSDGDVDVLSASKGNIEWYENLSLPIPVELTSFTVSTSKGKVTLNWTTATETNNNGFEVQRKMVNSDWEKIGFVEGHGTTTEPKEYSYVDDISGINASSLSYRLKQTDFDGSFEYSDEVFVDNPAPVDFALHQNFPNPYNPATTITYSLPIKSQVEIVIYNALGEKVIQLVNEEKEAGRHSVELNAASLPSGIYFYRIIAGSFVETKKMILMK